MGRSRGSEGEGKSEGAGKSQSSDPKSSEPKGPEERRSEPASPGQSPHESNTHSATLATAMAESEGRKIVLPGEEDIHHSPIIGVGGWRLLAFSMWEPDIETASIAGSQAGSQHSELMDRENRGAWRNSAEMPLAALGALLGLSCSWHWAASAMEWGALPFLLAWLVAALFLGLPLIILELAVGQATCRGPLAAWRLICPGFSGLAIYQVISAALGAAVSAGLNGLLIFLSLTSLLGRPWRWCDGGGFGAVNGPRKLNSRHACWDLARFKEASVDAFYTRHDGFEPPLKLAEYMETNCLKEPSKMYKDGLDRDTWQCSFNLRFDLDPSSDAELSRLFRPPLKLHPSNLTNSTTPEPVAKLDKCAKKLFTPAKPSCESDTQLIVLAHRANFLSTAEDIPARAECLKKVLQGTPTENKKESALWRVIWNYCQRELDMGTEKKDQVKCMKKVLDPDDSLAVTEWFFHKMNLKHSSDRAHWHSLDPVNWSWNPELVLCYVFGWALTIWILGLGPNVIARNPRCLIITPILVALASLFGTLFYLQPESAWPAGPDSIIEAFDPRFLCSLMEPRLCLAAAVNVLAMSGVGQGLLSSLASFNDPSCDLVKDSILIWTVAIVFKLILALCLISLRGLGAGLKAAPWPTLEGSQRSGRLIWLVETVGLAGTIEDGGDIISPLFFGLLAGLGLLTTASQLHVLLVAIGDIWPMSREYRRAAATGLALILSVFGAPLISGAAFTFFEAVDFGLSELGIPCLLLFFVPAVILAPSPQGFFKALRSAMGLSASLFSGPGSFFLLALWLLIFPSAALCLVAQRLPDSDDLSLGVSMTLGPGLLLVCLVFGLARAVCLLGIPLPALFKASVEFEDGPVSHIIDRTQSDSGFGTSHIASLQPKPPSSASNPDLPEPLPLPKIGFNA